MLTWTTEKRAVTELNPAPYNPRKWPEKDTKDLSTSLERFNLADPIIINLNNTIIGGHFRLNILRSKGVGEVDCRIPSRLLTEHEERELNLRLNRNLGQWDFDALANFDEDILKDVGFDSKELDRIFQLESKPEDDDIPEKPPTIAKLGDMWQLGRHRLLCGDSTDREQVLRLMGGEKADMVFTSPPYNLGVSAQLSGNTTIGNRGNAYEEYNDNKSENEWFGLMIGFTTNALEFAEYVFVNVQSLAGNRTALWEWVYTFKDKFCDVAIWDKSHGAPQLAHRVMNSVFEMIFVFKNEKPSRAIGQKEFHGTIDNVFRIPPQRRNEFAEIHGATFPVQLPETIIDTFTNREGIVLDPFLGSGSTLIACEKTNRICYGMEISPVYCDVIIKRFEDYTGQKAVKNTE